MWNRTILHPCGLKKKRSVIHLSLPIEPTNFPSALRGHSITSTSILVEWDAVPHEDQNGLILGYRVRYDTSEGWTFIQVDGSETFGNALSDLNEFSVYNICVLAFTVRGDGPESCILVVTAEDSKFCPLLVLLFSFVLMLLEGRKYNGKV